MTDELVRRAHLIAADLEQSGVSAVDGSTILSVALGIFMEAQAGSHRNLEPVLSAMLKAAQLTFDAVRTARERDPGHA